MVASSGGAERAGALRRLNTPKEIRVRNGDNGAPAAVRYQHAWLQVLEVLDHYRTDDRWWTSDPISRAYYELLLEDGRSITVFQDELEKRWWEQRYG
jgi:hypothetical protein